MCVHFAWFADKWVVYQKKKEFTPGKKMRFQGKAAVKEETEVIAERDHGKPTPMSQIFNPHFMDYQLMLGADLHKL